MSILETARKYREILISAMQSVDDKTGSEAPDLFPRLNNSGELVKAGTRINWKGSLKRAAVDLWDRIENNPDNAPTLWEDIQYKDGYRIIPDIITVGTAFALNEIGWWKDGNKYESLLNANVYTPEQYPNGWRKIAAENQSGEI
mgnify:CR=1 FL=1